MGDDNNRDKPIESAARTRVIAPGEFNPLFGQLLNGYLSELEAGHAPDKARLIAEHPELAPQLEQALARIESLHRGSASAASAPDHIGDFRIVREVGRGGMGVVYEAEQISLKRRVALKVLRLGVVADEVAMQRFRREAETIAQLHHTNIVPIFAIGRDVDVHFYAMQFIEGRDLADIAKESRSSGVGIDSVKVAGWGLQAAEALGHAHQRGVIHRDIKPSNLILDREGRIWLTDFGLARRSVDVTLSLAGALLGTPRYMSPEQASGATRPVDHRTDIYSLGATLYELATGRPIFEAPTAHELLLQILQHDPPAPRRIAPGVPRDLETIILKCLTKDAGQRYANAQALADDLRAFLDGRPIHTRRAGILESVTRWARKHRRTTATVGLSAGTALVLAVGAFFLWQNRQQARLGQISLVTDTPNLLAEVVDQEGNPLTPVFPVPMAEPISVPAGSQRLRLSASGLLSEIWPMEVGRRERRVFQVQLKPRWLWPPQEVNTAEYPDTEIVSLAGHADLLVLTHRVLDNSSARDRCRLRLVDGSTGQAAWDLVFTESTVPGGGNTAEWKELLAWAGVASTFKDTGIAERARDLDGDGTNDIVLLSRNSPSLVAVSGNSGRVLWWSRSHPRLSSGANVPPTPDRSGRGFVVGVPACADVDDDRVPDFIACFRSQGDTYVAADLTRHRTGAQSWLGAISGRTGAVLWQQPVTESWENYLNNSSDAEKFNAVCRPAVARIDGRLTALLVERDQLLGFDARTGEKIWAPLALGFQPETAPKIEDLDGDGQSEALFLRQRPGSEDDVLLQLEALSLSERKVRWASTVQSAPKWNTSDLSRGSRQVPLMTDLDGDGRAEVVFASSRRSLRNEIEVGLEVLDGATGSNRWRRFLRAERFSGSSLRADHFTVGPDLDGDSRRELFAAWNGYDPDRENHGLMVGAFSGQSGRLLWRWFEARTGAPTALSWWHAGADRWPLLLVSVHQAAGRRSATRVLSSGTGRLERILPDVDSPVSADFDGDGILDLFYTVLPQGAPRHLLVKGMPPEPWRRLGDWRIAADWDGDGDADLLGVESTALTARSGRDGRVLWRAIPDAKVRRFESPLPAGDFDGDRVPDVLVTATMMRQTGPMSQISVRGLMALSGRDGRQLWLEDQFDLFQSTANGGRGRVWQYRYPLLRWADLDRDNRAEVFCMKFTTNQQVQLSAMSGRDGRLLWNIPTTRGGFGLSLPPNSTPLADLNRDGVLDVALWSPKEGGARSESDELCLNVFDGRTGKPLWETPAIVSQSSHLLWPEPAVADLDGDGIPEVVVTRHGGITPRNNRYVCELLAVDGRSGQKRWGWTWDSGDQDVLPPVFLKAGRQTFIAVAVVRSEIVERVILDAAGQLLSRHKLNLEGNQLDSSRLVWRAADVDGDGRDELLFVDAGRLCVAGGADFEVRWRWTLPDSKARLAEVRQTPDAAYEVSVWAGRDVFGLNGANGKSTWRCAIGEAPRTAGSDPPEVLRAEAADLLGLPRFQTVLSTYGESDGPSVLHQAWPVNDDGRFAAPTPKPAAFGLAREFGRPKRPLPWAMPGDLREIARVAGLESLLLAGIPVGLMIWGQRRQSCWWTVQPVAYAAVAVAVVGQRIPALLTAVYSAWLLAGALRSRRGQGAALALACLGASVALMTIGLRAGPDTGDGATWSPRGSAPGFWSSLGLAVIGTPSLAFWVISCLALKDRRWKLLGWLLGASLAGAILAAGLMFWGDAPEKAHGQTYSMRGWYRVWFFGVWIAGLASLMILGGRQIINRIRRPRRHREATGEPA